MNEREHFVELLRGLPLVSVDLVLVRGGTEILLGLRTNRPAQGSWFVPGGRILKDEPRADALKRVAARELGIADVAALKPQLLGVFEHFYPDCFAGDIGVSTHYVVIAHRMSTIDMCDRIMVVEDGRVTALGTPDALLASSTFYRRALTTAGILPREATDDQAETDAPGRRTT